MAAIAKPVISSRDALPVCLRQENPYRLVSLLAMLKLNAHHFMGIANTFGQAIMDIRSGRVPHRETMAAVAGQCGLLQKYCEELNLPLTLVHLERFKDGLRADTSPMEYGQFLEEAQRRVWDELESRTFIAVDQSEARYFDDSQFPASVLERFQEAIFDADEAGKCLALERPTACAFHLMRVTEYGLQAVGKKLGIKDERPNWDAVILKIDAELKKPYKERDHKGMADFLANVSAHLNAVKVAWRNRVMHIDRKQTMEEAREIYGATVGLMRYIAENLPKDTGVVAIVRGIIKS